MNAPQPESAPLHLPGQLSLTVGQYSMAGRKARNEDAIGIRIPEGNLQTTKGAAAVIADGVSAAEAGQEASQTAVTSFLSDYFSTPESWSVKASAQQVLTALNRWLYGRGRHFGDASRGYICTFSALVIKSHQGHLFHVGDSRVYLLRGGELEQLSRDHCTPVSEARSYLTRALGLDVHLDVDYRQLNLEAGDLFLLTTDGIHDVFTNRELCGYLEGIKGEFEHHCRWLAHAAVERGSADSVSCQLLRVDARLRQGIHP